METKLEKTNVLSCAQESADNIADMAANKPKKKKKTYQKPSCTRVHVQVESHLLAGSVVDTKIETNKVDVKDYEDATFSGGFDVVDFDN